MKDFFKKMASIICFILTTPFFLCYKIESLFMKTEQPFCGMSQFFSLIPGLFGDYMRKEFYKIVLTKCSDDCRISFGTIFSHADTEIYDGVYIGTNCTIGKARLKENVLIGSNVDILSGKKQHSFESLKVPIKEQEREFEKINIGENTWIGNSSVVMANIGNKCIIGAGSVVVNDIEDLSVAVGNPARPIKKRI
jgi:acetyltransferase-like isoleucine patch superfamily enzyme